MRQVIFICALLWAFGAKVSAQTDSVYVYRKSGNPVRYVKSDIDSVRFSCVDLDGVEQVGSQVQEIWADGIALRMALTDIDSVVYYSPTREYRQRCEAWRVDRNNELWPAFAYPDEYAVIQKKIYADYIRSTFQFCPMSYPKQFWGKKEFELRRGTMAGTQVMAQQDFVLRDLPDLHFEGWIKFSREKSGTSVVTQQLIFELRKHMPNTSKETGFTFQFAENEHFENAKSAPVCKTVEAAQIGEVSCYVDDYIDDGNGHWFIHVTIDVDLPVSYGYLAVIYRQGSWLHEGEEVRSTTALIAPVVTSGTPFVYDQDSNAYNYGYAILRGQGKVTGKQGDVTQRSIKFPLTCASPKATMTTTDNGDGVDVHLHSESGLCNVQNEYTHLFQADYSFCGIPFDETGKVYYQFGIKLSDLLKIKALRMSSSPLLWTHQILAPGIRLSVNDNDYNRTVTWRVIGISEDSIVTLRLDYDIVADGLSSKSGFYVNVLSDAATDLSDLTLYDVCISNKPMGAQHNLLPSTFHPLIAGKSITVFGDSQHNSMELMLLTAIRAGMNVYNAAYGGHKMGWAGGSTTVNPETRSWLYSWNIRKKVLDNPTDYYLFCVSGNDLAQKNYAQLTTTEAIENVKSHYPCYGDDEAAAVRKMDDFEEMSATERYNMFNMTAVYCAYIEQILESNPNAKIILANSPITCSGMLTGSLSSDHRGQWRDGLSPDAVREKVKQDYDSLNYQMNVLAQKYNLPLLDFFGEIPLTVDNYVDYCVDGTHWELDAQTKVDGSINGLRNHHPIQTQESEILIRYLLDSVGE
ncbi:MAG: hypothetical protein IJ553_06110 [Alloprevotella sp.]|nr:hypothetical protein [Alloprevotella sp.]